MLEARWLGAMRMGRALREPAKPRLSVRQATRSAAKPGARRPSSSARPSVAAPPLVATFSASRRPIPVGPALNGLRTMLRVCGLWCFSNVYSRMTLKDPWLPRPSSRCRLQTSICLDGRIAPNESNVASMQSFTAIERNLRTKTSNATIYYARVDCLLQSHEATCALQQSPGSTPSTQPPARWSKHMRRASASAWPASLDALPSTPSPTTTPSSSKLRTGAMPGCKSLQ